MDTIAAGSTSDRRDLFRHCRERLRRWFCKKRRQPGRGFTHCPHEHLYPKLGLIRLPLLPHNFPWAKHEVPSESQMR